MSAIRKLFPCLTSSSQAGYRHLQAVMGHHAQYLGLSQTVVPQITIEDTLQIMLNTCSTIPYDALVARWHRPLIWVWFPVQWSGWTCQWCPSSKWATCSATMNCIWPLDQIVCLFGLYVWHSQYISVVPYYFDLFCIAMTCNNGIKGYTPRCPPVPSAWPGLFALQKGSAGWSFFFHVFPCIAWSTE